MASSCSVLRWRQPGSCNELEQEEYGMQTNVKLIRKEMVAKGTMVKKYVPDLHKPIYYLSGPEGMVKAMRTLLTTLEVDEDNIRTEEFTGY